MRRRGWVAAIGLSVSVAGCMFGFGGPLLTDGAVTVPTYPKGATACPLAALVPATLEGSADDPDHIWAVGIKEHNRIRLIWPQGFYGRLQPELEVIAYDGTVVASGRGSLLDVGGMGGGGDDVSFDVCAIGGEFYLPK